MRFYIGRLSKLELVRTLSQYQMIVTYYYYYYRSKCLEWHCRISCCMTTVQKYKNSIKRDKNV